MAGVIAIHTSHNRVSRQSQPPLLPLSIVDFIMGYLLAALLGGLLIFNGAATPEKAARMAQEALQKQYPTSKVSVQMEGKSGVNVLKGRFKRVHIAVSDLTVADLPFTPATEAKRIGKAGKMELDLRNLTWGSLPIARARFDFENLEYDFDALKKSSQFRIVRTGPAQMQVQVGAPSVAASFDTRLKDIENLAIAFEGDEFRLTGERDVLGYKTPVSMTAQPVGVGNEVRLDNSVIKVGGVTLPAMAANALLKDVNPIYVFDRKGEWPFRVNIQKVSAQNGFLDITAGLTLKSSP